MNSAYLKQTLKKIYGSNILSNLQIKKGITPFVIMVVISGCTTNTSTGTLPSPVPSISGSSTPIPVSTTPSPVSSPSASSSAIPTSIPTLKPSPTNSPVSTSVPANSPTFVTNMISQKCAYCHSIKPNSASGYNSAPSGITFDTVDEMKRMARQIKYEVVTTRDMPDHPITITDEERSLIGKWADQQ